MAQSVIDGFDLARYELTAWGKNKDFKKPFEFITPSGQRTLCRRLDMGDIIKLGVAEDLDFMTKALVAETAKEGEKQPEVEQNASVIMSIIKGENFEKMETAINAVCVEGVLAPKIHAVPPLDSARQAGLLYVDSLPFNDRMVLFSEIFETEGLTTFREEPETGMGSVPDVGYVSLSTE